MGSNPTRPVEQNLFLTSYQVQYMFMLSSDTGMISGEAMMCEPSILVRERGAAVGFDPPAVTLWVGGISTCQCRVLRRWLTSPYYKIMLVEGARYRANLLEQFFWGMA